MDCNRLQCDTSALDEAKLRTMNEIKKIDAQVATKMMECDRMESAVRALNEEKSRKDNGLKSVESEMAQRKMELVGWNLISVHWMKTN